MSQGDDETAGAGGPARPAELVARLQTTLTSLHDLAGELDASLRQGAGAGRDAGGGAAADAIRLRTGVVGDELTTPHLELVLSTALAAHVELVGSCLDTDEVRGWLAAHELDAVVVALPPGPRLSSVLACVGRPRAGVPTLVVADVDDDVAVELLREGADAVVTTGDSGELLGPLLAVASGWRLAPTSATDELLERHVRTSEVAARLDEEELELLAQIAAGHTDRHMAERSLVSERTNKRRVRRLLDKLGVANRLAAARLAGELGVPPVAPDGPVTRPR